MTKPDPKTHMSHDEKDRLPYGFTPETAANDAYFTSRLPELLPLYEGKWALIHRQTVVGIFDTEDAADDAGSAMFWPDEIYLGHIVATPDEEFLFLASTGRRV